MGKSSTFFDSRGKHMIQAELQFSREQLDFLTYSGLNMLKI